MVYHSEAATFSYGDDSLDYLWRRKLSNRTDKKHKIKLYLDE
ncbi:hypothetical protein LOK49_LG09G02534 [Camellia lanceoleosa]|uniref:Uncharacterized protein n=1 Tax=Camellia lanceoleosa TaxID=1840588 RepID=A0ACC0GGU0_9ERIC|nr:hypothetical protein LOK49_LG09G02534 [Camellia lanceoleosa]